MPRGGPDGGDGGKGGDVVFVVRQDVRTLSHLKMRRSFRAEDGRPGGKARKHGANGRDVLIHVPLGTTVWDVGSDEVLQDLDHEDARWVFLRGAQGGKGNYHFATSTRQSPRFAQPGRKGHTRSLVIQLRLIADVGLVGLPNAGKSTLLSVLTNAHPQVGSYPFTTVTPNIGVLRVDYQDILMADIPGIVQGAATGVGLGLQFLKHISRSSHLVFLVDLGESTFLEAVDVLTGEFESFSPALVAKRRLIVGTKLDLPCAESRLRRLCTKYHSEPVLGISAHTGVGIAQLVETLRGAVLSCT